MKKIITIKPEGLYHLLLTGIVTVLCGLIYISVQQVHRSMANDPQLSIAREIANRLNKDLPVKKSMDADTVELENSLSVFITFYNSNKEATQSTGLLHAHFPQLPNGVYEFVNANKEDVFTWQPEAAVRMAVVLEKVKSPTVAYVAVGRSLTETEKRESNLVKMVFIAWLICNGMIVLHWFIMKLIFSKTNN